MKSLFVDSHTHLGKANRKVYSIQELETSMNQANIDISIVIADRTSGKLATNDYLATLSKNNSKIRVVADISSKEFNDEGFQKIYNFFRNDFVGVKLYPGYENFFPYDKKLFPLYDLCSRLDRPVIIHTGVLQVGSTGFLKQVHPFNVDEVASRFSRLKIVMAHSGNPWLFDCASVITKNKNVYADISGYFNEFKTLSKKEVDLFIKNFTEIKIYMGKFEKFLFGTDWPLYSQKEYLEATLQLHLTKKEFELLFFKNANNVFNLGL